MRGGHADGGLRAELEIAWERFMDAERASLVARAGGNLARALRRALPEESQEKLDRMAEEDRRLAREGLVPLMDEDGGIYHKHVDKLAPGDGADRVRAEKALADWLMSRTEERLELLDVWRHSKRGRTD